MGCWTRSLDIAHHQTTACYAQHTEQSEARKARRALLATAAAAVRQLLLRSADNLTVAVAFH
jgi:hypothetical protein